MVLCWMKACKWRLFTASLKVSFGCICSASLSSRGPHKAFWNEKSWSSSSSKRILSGGGRYSFWWNKLLYHRHCVTRAPLLLLRSWVALSFKVVSQSVLQGSVTTDQISTSIYKGMHALYWPNDIKNEPVPIPDICHGSHGYIRVNFF